MRNLDKLKWEQEVDLALEHSAKILNIRLKTTDTFGFLACFQDVINSEVIDLWNPGQVDYFIRQAIIKLSCNEDALRAFITTNLIQNETFFYSLLDQVRKAGGIDEFSNIVFDESFIQNSEPLKETFKKVFDTLGTEN